MLLTSGLTDKTAVLTRADRDGEHVKFDVESSIETIQWIPHLPSMFAVGTSDGLCKVYDTKKPGKPLYMFQAHDNAECSVITFNQHIPGLMASGSNDKSISLWDVRKGHKLVVNRTLGVGEVFALEFNMNNPYLLVGGGSAAEELVWTIQDDIKDCGFEIGSAGGASSSSSSSNENDMEG